MENNEDVPVQEKTLRSKLVSLLLEHFVCETQLDIIQPAQWELELKALLRNMLAFDVDVQFNNDTSSVMSGMMMFMDQHNGEMKPKVINFDAWPAGKVIDNQEF